MQKNYKNKSIAYIVSMRAGLEAFIYREVEALYERGYKIELYATQYKQGDVYSPKENWPYFYVSKLSFVVLLPLLLIKALLKPGLLVEAMRDKGVVDLLLAYKFSAIMKRNDVRQIHCHFGDHKFFIGYYCKRLTGLPLSVTIHAHEFYTNPNEALFVKSLNYADTIFPIAHKWVDLLKTRYGLSEDKIILNHLFVDTNENKPDNSLSVLAVGRFTERKGFVYLMRALKQLEDINVRAVFIGFGELDLNKMAVEEGVAERVTVFNKMDQSQLRYFYQTCDILCVPSITTEKEGAEGIPVVLMEGLACGLPVVTTPCGAIQELVDEYIVDEHSTDGIAHAIRHLANDPDLRKQKGEHNRRKVINEFSVANIEKFGHWLDDMVDAKGNS